MNNIISWYNRNRRKIIVVLTAVAIIGLIIWRIINMGFETSIQNQVSNNLDINNQTYDSIIVTSEKSAISNQKLQQSQNEEIQLIDKFTTLCNEGKVQEAYNLVSNECKDEMYENLKDFQQAYYNPIYKNGKKNVSVSNWNKNIYKVQFDDDFLATGEYKTDNTIQDYITVVEDNEGNKKLNINNYIGRTLINKESNSDNINLKVLKRDTYMNYEYYTYEVINNRQEPIVLCDNRYTESSYLEDNNNLKYTAYLNELSTGQLTFEKMETRQLKVKYYNEYNSNNSINKIVFPEIILNYEAYMQFEEAGENPTAQIIINLN